MTRPPAAAATIAQPLVGDEVIARRSAGVGKLDSQMTRFVVDCGVVLHLVRQGIKVPAEHELLAPTLLGGLP